MTTPAAEAANRARADSPINPPQKARGSIGKIQIDSVRSAVRSRQLAACAPTELHAHEPDDPQGLWGGACIGA